MKKITFLLILLTMSFGYAQPNTAAPTPPARDAGDVISIFTQTVDAATKVYNDILVSNFNPNWGSSSGNVTIDPFGGDRALTYPNFDYQGTVIGSNINLSSMTTLNVDIWTNTVSPNVYLISDTTGEKFVNVPAAANQWTTVAIPLSDYTSQGLSISDIKEFKFATDSGVSGVTIYLDNFYFSRPAVDPTTDATLSDLQVDGATISGFGPGTTSYTYSVAPGTTVVPQITTATTTNVNASRVITQATGIPGTATVVVTAENTTDTETYTVSIETVGPPAAATTPPNRAAANVISVYSDAYTNVADDSDSPETFGGSVFSEIDFSGNSIISATTPNSGAGFQYKYFGTTPQYLNLSAMSTAHIDFYFEGSTAAVGTIMIFIVQYSDGTNIQENFDVTSLASDTWHEYDIDFADFDSNAGNPRDAIRQVIVQTAGAGGADVGPFYVDNIYFHNGIVLGTDDFSKTSFNTYPNPTQDKWTIETQNVRISSITVYDVLGKSVMTMEPKSETAVIDGSSLKSGLYFAKVETAEGVSSVKLVKK